MGPEPHSGNGGKRLPGNSGKVGKAGLRHGQADENAPARGKELMEFSLSGMLVSVCKRGLIFNF